MADPNTLTAIVTASAALFGVTIAQILNHWLIELRRKREERRKAIMFINAIVSDIDFTCMHLATILSHFDDILEEKEYYELRSDAHVLEFSQLYIEKFDYSLPVHPGLIHRARAFFSSVNSIVERLRGMTAPAIVNSGRRVLVEYLVYGLSLAVAMSENIVQTRRFSEVQLHEALDRYRGYSFAGGGAHLTPHDLETLISKVRTK